MKEKELSQKPDAVKRRKAIKKWIENGLCRDCGHQREDEDFVSCQRCRERGKKKSSDYRKEAIKYGHCSDCRTGIGLQSMIDLGKVPLCEECYLKRMAVNNGFNVKDGAALKQILEAQNFRCYYTGELITLGGDASIDHKNPKSRFPEQINDLNNICWSTLDINFLKRTRTVSEFIMLCKKVVETIG